MRLSRVAAVLVLTVATLSSPVLSQLESSHGQRITTSPAMYEDDRIQVAIPPGWSVEEAYVPVYGGTTEEVVGKMHVGAVLSRGRYRVYLLTHYSQASGIVGGRFGEIAKFVAPMTDQSEESRPCSDNVWGVPTSVTSKLDRIDLYLNIATAKPGVLALCGNPTVGATLWYGSYFTGHCPPDKPVPQDCGGYFLDSLFLADKPNAGAGKSMNYEMVFTVSYAANKADLLPHKGDPQLNRILGEASAIVRSIKFKNPEPGAQK